MVASTFTEGFIHGVGTALGYLAVGVVALVIGYGIYLYFLRRAKRALKKAMIDAPLDAAGGVAGLAKEGARLAMKHGPTALEHGTRAASYGRDRVKGWWNRRTNA